ncbi:MAG: hypothetical protein HYX75_17795 [Acidobacteria bacterium]|nr:hypothetical protein [Acidobacteriota bacterium]
MTALALPCHVHGDDDAIDVEAHGFVLGDFTGRVTSEKPPAGRSRRGGVGDLLFINDVFPKDWVSFFAGRPMEYLKVGVDGVRLRYTGSHVNGEILALPFF